VLYAPLPKGATPQEISYEEALELIAAKAERMRKRGRDPYAVRGVGGKDARVAMLGGR
jgi:topoisomerase IA-like protein